MPDAVMQFFTPCRLWRLLMSPVSLAAWCVYKSDFATKVYLQTGMALMVLP